jgi:protein subunit release factor B
VKKQENEKRKPLLSVTTEDCRWEYFRASGAGGQKRNKTSNAVRCTHEDSGAVGQATESRKQSDNRKMAFKRMAESEKFKTWVKIESSRRLGKETKIQKEVEKSMSSQNLKIEGKDENGCWVEIKEIQ